MSETAYSSISNRIISAIEDLNKCYNDMNNKVDNYCDIKIRYWIDQFTSIIPGLIDLDTKRDRIPDIIDMLLGWRNTDIGQSMSSAQLVAMAINPNNMSNWKSTAVMLSSNGNTKVSVPATTATTALSDIELKASEYYNYKNNNKYDDPTIEKLKWIGKKGLLDIFAPESTALVMNSTRARRLDWQQYVDFTTSPDYGVWINGVQQANNSMDHFDADSGHLTVICDGNSLTDANNTAMNAVPRIQMYADDNNIGYFQNLSTAATDLSRNIGTVKKPCTMSFTLRLYKDVLIATTNAAGQLVTTNYLLNADSVRTTSLGIASNPVYQNPRVVVAYRTNGGVAANENIFGRVTKVNNNYIDIEFSLNLGSSQNGDVVSINWRTAGTGFCSNWFIRDIQINDTINVRDTLERYIGGSSRYEASMIDCDFILRDFFRVMEAFYFYRSENGLLIAGSELTNLVNISTPKIGLDYVSDDLAKAGCKGFVLDRSVNTVVRYNCVFDLEWWLTTTNYVNKGLFVAAYKRWIQSLVNIARYVTGDVNFIVYWRGRDFGY